MKIKAFFTITIALVAILMACHSTKKMADQKRQSTKAYPKNIDTKTDTARQDVFSSGKTVSAPDGVNYYYEKVKDVPTEVKELLPEIPFYNNVLIVQPPIRSLVAVIQGLEYAPGQDFNILFGKSEHNTEIDFKTKFLVLLYLTEGFNSNIQIINISANSKKIMNWPNTFNYQVDVRIGQLEMTYYVNYGDQQFIDMVTYKNDKFRNYLNFKRYLKV